MTVAIVFDEVTAEIVEESQGMERTETRPAPATLRDPEGEARRVRRLVLDWQRRTARLSAE